MRLKAKYTQKKSPQKQQVIDNLTMWEWETLVASWRYYEHGMTISSACFPHDIVQRYYGEGNNYSDNVRKTIANQFVNIDHHGKGEHDWDDSGMSCDKRAWRAFYRFCEAWLNGFHTIGVKRVDGKIERLEAFHTDFEDRWYIKDIYIAHGTNMTIPKENIVEVPCLEAQ